MSLLRQLRRQPLIDRLNELLDEINVLAAGAEDTEALCRVFDAASDAIFDDDFGTAKAILTGRRAPVRA